MKAENGFVEHTLANGLRVIVEPMPHVQSVAGGFLVRVGGRDEPVALAGAAHFVEHMCFKGTGKRHWRQITIDFDNMGSTYNAYTSKERTVYFGWVRTADLARQLELLADMMRSVMPAEEFELERKVILEEIATSQDQIGHRLSDLIHEHVYGRHSLSWPILGTTETIEALSRERLRAYFEEAYHPANIVLIVAGAVEPAEVIDLATGLCGDWAGKAPRSERQGPASIGEGVGVEQAGRFEQQAVALVYPAPSAVDEERETADVLAEILGGHNSRFFWNIVQAGIAPQVGVVRAEYCDIGLILVFGFCEPGKAEQLLAAMREQIAKLSREGVREEELQQVKNRVRTMLAMEAESPYYRFRQLVQDVDALGRPRTVFERLAAVDGVSTATVRDYLAAWPMTGRGWLTSLGPRDWPASG